MKRYSSGVLIAAFLMISVLAVFIQVRDFGFIYYDDPKYVRDNPMVAAGLNPESVRWAFSSMGYASNWHPLTWISHMIDVEIFGLDPGGHHLANVIIHVLNSLLLFLVLHRMTRERWKSAAVSLLFALHPLHVESVAWIAERKDVLSAFFWMLTMWAYLMYVERRGAARYLLVAVTYALGLMAKPMLVTLPFVLLLLDFWPIRRQGLLPTVDGQPRVNWNGLVPLLREKAPLFVLAGVSCIVTYHAQVKGGAVSSLDLLPFYSRIANAAVAYAVYISKFFWPVNLSVFYPYPSSFSLLPVAGSLVLLLLITLAVLRSSRSYPWALTGWLWYLGTLVPVIGIVQVGSQSMADRYMYIPLIGLSIMLVWGVACLFEGRRYGNLLKAALLTAILPFLLWASWVQAGFWKDSITLFSHALDVTDDNYLAHANLAAALYEKGDIPGTISHSGKALAIRPDYVPAHSNLGLGLMKTGRYREAIDHFREAVRINPDHVNAYANLGSALFRTGKTDEAVRAFREVLRRNPGHEGARKGIELALRQKGRTAGLTEKIREALRSDPQNHDLHYRLAEIYMGEGKKKDALEQYEKVVSLKPDSAEVLHILAVQYAGEGEYDKALSSLQKMAELKPDDPDVYYNMTCVYSRQGRRDDAVAALRTALDKGFRRWDIIEADPDLENIRGTDLYRKLIRR